MVDLILNIITFGLKPLYEKNISYYNLISDFRKKLPRPQNEARKITDEEIDKNPFLPESMKYVNALDLSAHKTSITEQELDMLMNSIQYFDYSLMLFKSYYKAYSKNILRFKPTSENGNFDLVMLQQILKDDPIHPLKPIPVIVHHFKYKIKPFTTFYVWNLKCKRRNSLISKSNKQ
jgi:hypothetical protein